MMWRTVKLDELFDFKNGIVKKANINTVVMVIHNDELVKEIFCPRKLSSTKG